MEMQKQKGFSLIELLIVVAIILIIAAIAIPNLLRARIAADEASAVSSLRTIATAQVTYATSYPTVGYANALSVLGPANAGCTAGPAQTNACMIDFALGSATTTAKSGYVFEVIHATGTPVTTYVSDAGPHKYNQTGVRTFCSIEDAVLHFNTNASGTSGLPGDSSATCVGYPVLQ
jgi:prepilin-type N-terminal cleavage/methylation domain-containing protein